MTSDPKDATQEGRVKMAAGSEHGLKRIVWQSKFIGLFFTCDGPPPPYSIDFVICYSHLKYISPGFDFTKCN